MRVNLRRSGSDAAGRGSRDLMRADSGVHAPLPDDRPLRAGMRSSVFLAGAVTVLLAWLLADFPDAVERYYTGGMGLLLSRTLTRISGLAPFSVAEMAAIGFGFCVLFLALRGVIQVARRRRRMANAAACGILWCAATTGVLLFSGYLCWGFNFARADLIARQHWPKLETQRKTDANRDELTLYCSRLLDLTNREFEKAVGSKDPGKSSTPPGPISVMDDAIEEAYAKVTAILNLPSYMGVNRGRAKSVFTSIALSAMLIGGFYSPWTGEANFNRDLPPHTLPQAIAHEKAHQRQITNEDEANFFGFLACINARDPYVRYSGYLFAQQQLMGELRMLAPERAAELIVRRDGGIQRDIAANRRFVERHRGLLSDANSVAIDTYLKANRAPAGIGAYSLSARLIILYARTVDSTFSR